MSGRPQTKMCWNCEGNVLLSEQYCPYCRVELDVQAPADREEVQQYPPLYRTMVPKGDEGAPTTPLPSLGHPMLSEELEQSALSDESSSDTPQGEDQTLKVVGAMTLLMFGAIFVLFSAALLLFGAEGYLVLRWEDANWYFYLLLGLPMLFFGWRLAMGIAADECEG